MEQALNFYLDYEEGETDEEEFRETKAAIDEARKGLSEGGIPIGSVLVKDGKISNARIDSSVKRLLRQKFELGLFDNPFIDESKAPGIVGKPEFVKAGEESQRRAITLLKNENKTLPLKQGKLKIYVRNVDPKVASRYGTIVDKPEEADLAILRLNTPFYPVETPIMMARMFHHGDLDFKSTQKDSILQLLKTVPTIVDIY